MLAVTILLVVLIGAISGLSWVALDGQSSAVLHAIANGGGDVSWEALPAPKPFLPPMNMDTLQSARFFVVHVDGDGKVLDVDVEQISSISAEEAAQYAALITDAAGKTGPYKYEVKQLGVERLIIFSGYIRPMGERLPWCSASLPPLRWFAGLRFSCL